MATILMIFIAAQPWLNLVGLLFDFIGVMLLAYEWRVALRAERRELELAEREALLEVPPSMPQPGGEHRAMFEYMERKRKANMRAIRARTTFSSRRRYFVTAFVFIALGFLLQIIGSIPL